MNIFSKTAKSIKTKIPKKFLATVYGPQQYRYFTFDHCDGRTFWYVYDRCESNDTSISEAVGRSHRTDGDGSPTNSQFWFSRVARRVVISVIVPQLLKQTEFDISTLRNERLRAVRTNNNWGRWVVRVIRIMQSYVVHNTLTYRILTFRLLSHCQLWTRIRFHVQATMDSTRLSIRSCSVKKQTHTFRMGSFLESERSEGSRGLTTTFV